MRVKRRKVGVTDVTVGGFLKRTAPDVMVKPRLTFQKTPSIPTVDTINGWERDYYTRYITIPTTTTLIQLHWLHSPLSFS